MRTVVDRTDEDGGEAEDSKWHENPFYRILDQPQGLPREDLYVKISSANEMQGSTRDVQKSCSVSVVTFNRNSAMLRKKNTCSMCKSRSERLLTPERVTYTALERMLQQQRGPMTSNGHLPGAHPNGELEGR